MHGVRMELGSVKEREKQTRTMYDDVLRERKNQNVLLVNLQVYTTFTGMHYDIIGVQFHNSMFPFPYSRIPRPFRTTWRGQSSRPKLNSEPRYRWAWQYIYVQLALLTLLYVHTELHM